MNRNIFKVIFSRTLGQLTVVSENTTANGKAAAESSGGVANGWGSSKLNSLSFLLMLAFGTVAILPAQAQVVADPTAPGSQQATVLTTASGVTQVNIQTPSAQGVSVNQYKQFDVQSNGVVLNNSRTAANTQIAGYVQGNPWLATGSARVIVNNVNSTNPSYLNGYVEIAGQKAEVIIANPAGISVSGGGFINASRTTLTTGTPIINGGSLEGYRVTSGQITVDGQGLDTSQSDYTDILARSVKVNAGIWANNLKVTAGANQIDAANSTATAITGTGTAPSYAIDTAALGGMYAGKIILVGTEQGLGVNNAGQLAASAGNVAISSNGMLTNSGTINANGADNAVTINTTGVANSGTISSQGNNHIVAATVQNSGTLAAGRELKVNATDIDNTNGVMNGQRVEVNAASLNNTKGKIQQTGSQALALNAGSLSNTNGGLIGYEPITSGSGTGTGSTGGSTGGTTGGSTGTTDTPSTAAGGGTATVVQPAPVVLADGVINVTGNVNNDAGQITANGGIDLTSSNGLTNSATLNLNKITVTGNALDNSNGTITSTQATVNTNSITNTAGKFGSSGNVDLTANSLTNSKGQITAGGTLISNISGTVLNDDGTMGSAGEHTLNVAGSINNTNGTIASTGAGLTVQSGAVNNTKGAIQSATSTKITSTTFDNTDGKVAGTNVNLNNQNNALTNTRGTVSADSTTVNSGALTNDAGLIQGSNELTINTNGQNLTNTNSGTTGGIVSGGTLKVDSGDVNNSAGYVSSKGNATINAAQIANNNGGQIIGEADNTLTATGIDNRGGQVITVGNANIAVGAGTVNNDNSLIRSGGTTTINAATLINTNTNATDKGIDSGTVALNANTVDNTAGAIRADETLTITSSGTVNNTNGLLTSSKVIEVKDPNASKILAITNTNGTVIAGTSNTIAAKSLTGDGKVLSNGDVSVTLTDDFTNNATVQAANNLTLTSAGTVANNAKILAGATNSVNAQNINNVNGAEISGGTTKVTANDAVTNRGLIDGINTVVKGNTVTNLGTGRIYGDHLSIGANTLTNTVESGTAATIAARNRLDIGATTINNQEHSTLFSGGEMSIGGALDANNNATGRANVINNESATIESLGNMRLAANQINNRNMHFATAIQQVSQERVGEVIGVANTDPNSLGPVPAGVSQLYTVDSTQLANMPNLGNELPGNYMVNAANNVYIAPDQSNYLVAPEGAYSSWELRDFTRTTSESVVTQTDPSKIIAGGNLTLDTGNLYNDNSQIIVGGTLDGDAANITNSQTAGQRIVSDSGTRLSNWRDHDKGRDEPGTETNPYNVTHPTQSITIDTSVKQIGVNGNTGMSVGGMNGNNLTDTATGSSTANASATVYAVDTTDPTLIKTGAVNTNMPNSSLFTVNPNNAGYLIETDPRFADYRQWLSSDFMLASLNLDPALMHKRLGDGFYEQKLIREQIAQLTGRRYLTGYGNDDDQYKALMNAGVTFAGQYNLRPGIALTNEQMARLTSDIVWLVEEEVTLPNGTKTRALVPKVYVAVKPGDIDGSGSLISANRINLNLSGDLNNAGTVSGRTVTQITAQNINNMGGRINADQLNLNARNDLNNIGGLIDANTSAVLHAGRDVNSVTTTSTAANNYGSKTIIDRVAGIYVGNGADVLLDPLGSGTANSLNTLSITAGNNVNLVGSDVTNDGIGGTRIAADNNVNLSTVQVANTESFYRNSKNGYKIDEKSDVGTIISGVGNVTLSAKNDLNARAADVNSEVGTLTAVAGNDVNITAGQNTRSTVADDFEKQSGFLKKKTTTVHTESDTTTSVGSNFTGAQVIVSAGHDANIVGSNVISDDLTVIAAKNNVNIVASEDTSTTNRFVEKTTSGLMGSGGIGFTVGKKMNSTDTDSTTVTQNGSTVGSLQGNTVIQAGNHYQQTASTVNSPVGDVSIKAKSVDIVAGYNTEDTTTTSIQKQSGFTVALSTPVTDAIMAAKAVYDGAQDIGKSKNDRVNAMAVANTAWGAYQAGKGLASATGMTGSGSGSGGSGVSVSITYGQSEAKQTSVDKAVISVGSTVNAGGKVNITATGAGDDSNINIVGSDVYGGTGAALKADNQINIVSATDVISNRSKNESYSANAGVAIAFDNGVSFGITAGGSYGKGKSNSDTVNQHNSHVGSGGLTTIESGGTTTIAGGQVTGKRVEVDAADLVIQSKQDTSKANSQQFDASLQVTVGYGFSASGSVSASKAKADYASVNEQSGIIAGDGGYDVNVKNNTNLIGGIVTSSQAAEDNHLNSFSTGTLTSTDVQNHADYSATGFGIGGGFAMNGTGAQNGMTPQNQNSTNATGQLNQGKASLTVNKSVGFGMDSGHDRSTTESGINTSNITITNPEAQAATGKSVEQIKAEVATDTVTDTVALNSGHIENNYDAQAVQDEINLQVRVSQQFDQNRQQAKAEINKEIDDLKKDMEKATTLDEKQAIQKKLDAWERGGLILDSVAGALYGPNSNGIAGTIAQVAAPHIANQIGEYFSRPENSDNQVGHVLAHAVLGAALAAATGNDLLSGALAAGGSEAVAPALANWLYGETDTSKLTAEQKSTISAITGLGGAGLGLATGGTGTDAASAALIAQNSTENNYLTVASPHTSDLAQFLRNRGELQSKCATGDTQCIADANAKAEAMATALSKFRDEKMLDACTQDYNSRSCQTKLAEAKAYLNDPTVKLYGFGARTREVIAEIEKGKTQADKAAAVATVALQTLNDQTRANGVSAQNKQLEDERKYGSFKQMDGTQVMSLSALLPTIEGTAQYNDYQRRVAATDGRDSVYTVTGTRHAPGIMTPDTPTRIGDIATTDAGNRIIVTGQNADGTFRARLVAANEDPYIVGYVNRVQSISYAANGAAALAQAGASAMTTPRTGTVGTGSNTYSPRSDAVFAEQANPLSNARYAQTTYSESFSELGSFSGRTVASVASDLRSGVLTVKDLPIEYIVRDGNVLILNTRSAQALEQAGIPRAQWNGVNVSSNPLAQNRLSGQLQRNKLTNQGTRTVRQSGGAR